MLSELRELYRFRELLYNLVSRDLKARYKHSFFGFLWSLLNPLLQIATLTVVFKHVMKIQIDNFAPFLFAAFLPWVFFQTTIMDASAAVLLNARIIKRVYLPREILPLTQVASNLIHFLLALVVLFGYLIIGPPVTFQWQYLVYLPLIILLQTVMLAGLALVVSCASVFFEDVRFLVSALLNLVFYASCIFFPLHATRGVPSLEGSSYWWVAWVNPVVPLVTLYRQALLHNTNVPDAGPVDHALLLRVAVWAVGLFLLGYAFFNARKWEFAERI